MSVATDVGTVKRRIDDYLWRSPATPVARLRQIINSHFAQFERVVIIGGFVRDFARAGATAFRSDIDLVIDAPQHMIADLARTLGASSNRFGGYGYHHPQWKIDFWALETTWAASNGHVHVHDVSDLTQCTFFDWDAALYDLRTHKVICESKYLELLRANTIDINLRPTPSINGNLLRSVRRLLLWNASAGSRLRDFINEHLTAEALRQISSTESKIYPNPLLGRFREPNELLDQLYSLDRRAEINTSFAAQLPLPGI